MLKRIKIYTILSTSLVLILSSCVNYELSEPDEAIYNPDIEATTSIDELLNLYEGGLTFLDTNVVISGTVIANDRSGNLYKAIIIQDSTAGIEISLNAYELHNDYHVGDLIYIKCEGLYLGQYGGVVKLGSDYEGDIGRIEEPLIDQYLIKSDGGVPIVPKELFIATPNASLVNQLVVINNTQFSVNSVGGTYADADLQIDGEIPLEDCDGNSMIVRTSGYADFARDTLPSGNGQIIAVLGRYNGEYQLLIRDVNEVNLENVRCGAIFEETFEGNLGVFSQYSVIGENQVWEYSSQYDCAVMSGYDNGNYANEDWLISPAIDLSIYSDLVLNFRHAYNYSTSNGTDDIEVYICNDYSGTGDPNMNGTWTKLTGIIYPPGNNWTWLDSGDIDISAFAGDSNVFFAFKYRSTASDACTWEIDRISISVSE